MQYRTAASSNQNTEQLHWSEYKKLLVNVYFLYDHFTVKQSAPIA